VDGLGFQPVQMAIAGIVEKELFNCCVHTLTFDSSRIAVVLLRVTRRGSAGRGRVSGW